MKRVFIVHGWGGNPEEGWFPWLKRELEAKGYEVHVPQLPEADKPRIQNWVPKLAEVVSTPDENTYFVGHSMGCQTIARYLETLPDGVQVGGVVFVAGFFKRLTALSKEDIPIADAWFTASIDFVKIRTHIPNSVALFSDDDPYVPLDNQDDFRDKLGSDIVTVSDMGHFSGNTGTTELPIVLQKLLEMVG